MAAISIGVFGVGQCEAEMAKKHLRLNGVTRFGLEDPQLGLTTPLRPDIVME